MTRKHPFQSENLKRNTSNRRLRRTFLIVTEGQKTEPLYFEGFGLSSVKICGLGCNSLSLVKRAIDLKNLHPEMDQVWCVFDRDSFKPKQINEAIQMADKNEIRIAFSNESFELWYLLHFDYMDCSLNRGQYIEKLNNYLGIDGYSKNRDIYQNIESQQKTAIRNARKLLTEAHNIVINQKAVNFKDRYLNLDPVKTVPFTTVYELVEELLSELNLCKK